VVCDFVLEFGVWACGVFWGVLNLMGGGKVVRWFRLDVEEIGSGLLKKTVGTGQLIRFTVSESGRRVYYWIGVRK